jgi:hypothetical protein
MNWFQQLIIERTAPAAEQRALRQGLLEPASLAGGHHNLDQPQGHGRVLLAAPVTD